MFDLFQGTCNVFVAEEEIKVHLKEYLLSLFMPVLDSGHKKMKTMSLRRAPDLGEKIGNQPTMC